MLIRVCSFGLALLLASRWFANAQSNDAPPAPPAPLVKAAPWNAPEEQRPKSNWNVRLEMLVVNMPQAKGLPLLPALKDEQKIESAITEIDQMIEKKEATLVGWPTLWTLSGQRAQSETIEEKRYPTEFDALEGDANSGSSKAGVPAEKGAAPKAPLVDNEGYVLPTAFETRNCGVTLEAEPHVLGKGELIRVNLVPQRVVLLGFDEFEAVKTTNGKISKVGQPQFATNKIQGEVIVKNGRPVLIAVHKMVRPEEQLEFFILRATAVQMK